MGQLYQYLVLTSLLVHRAGGAGVCHVQLPSAGQQSLAEKGQSPKLVASLGPAAGAARAAVTL